MLLTGTTTCRSSSLNAIRVLTGGGRLTTTAEPVSQLALLMIYLSGPNVGAAAGTGDRQVRETSGPSVHPEHGEVAPPRGIQRPVHRARLGAHSYSAYATT
jgi:hypothetical protein